MKLFDNLKLIIEPLSQTRALWALCGGIAASIYRETPRFTGDIDIAILDSEYKSAASIAEDILKKMGHPAIPGFIPGLLSDTKVGPAMIVSRHETSTSYHGIDFLLPLFPWVPGAVLRAQANILDYGFAKIPTITAEDLIIAKLFAYKIEPNRPFDLDDIRGIQAGVKGLDYEIIKTRCLELNIPAPADLKIW